MHLIKNTLKNMMFKRTTSKVVLNENLIFRNNYRKKLDRLLLNARNVMMSRWQAVPLKSLEVPSKAVKPKKVSLVQVIFLEIALALGTSSLNKVSKQWLMRFLFIQYVFFCLITSQAYFGSLGSFMIYPNEKGQIHTPEALYERNLKLLGAPQSKRILERSFSNRQILKKLSERFVDYKGYYDDLLTAMYQNRNTSTFATTRLLQFYINNNPLLRNNPNSIYIFPRCTVNSYSSPFLFQRGSPFIDPVNKILFRIIESGITQKWYQSATPRKQIVRRDPVQRLDLTQILGCFIILIVLHVGALLVFFGELVAHAYNVRTRDK